MKNSNYLILLILTSNFLFAQQNFRFNEFHYSPNFIENKGQFDNPYFKTKGKILYAVDQNAIQIYFTDRAEVIYRIEQKIKNSERKKGDYTKPKKLAIREIVKSEWVNPNSNFQVVCENPSLDYHNYAMLSEDSKNVYSIDNIRSYGKLIYKNIYPNVDIEYEVKKEGGVKYSLILKPGADLSKISLQYDKNIILQDSKVIIPTVHGNIVENQPYSFIKRNKKFIPSSFFVEENKVKYRLDGNTISEAVVFDPWVQTPSLPNSNGVWEVETDALGNIYVIGGDMPMKLLKYNSAGVLQWTYNTPYDTANFWLGTLATDNAGFSYITSGSSANIQKINPSGGLVWNASGGLNDEYWAISFSADQTRLIVGGTRLNPLNIAASNGVIFDINTNNGSQITRVNVAGTRQGPLGLGMQPNEVRSLTSSRNGRYYFLTLDSIGGVTRLFGNQANCSNTITFKNQSDYNFDYKSEFYRPVNGNSGIKAIRANDRFIYTHNGVLVHRRDLNTGAILGTFNIPGGINTVSLGYNQPGNNGIEVDSCGNVYVGSSDRIIKLDPFLNVLQTINLPFRVFDIAIGNNGEVVVCGATGNSNSTSRTGYVQSINMGSCLPFPLLLCDATICKINPVCQNATAFNLVAATPGGVWSGNGITNATNGTFNPSVAGVGTHWVYYTLSCGSDSIQIQVNSCATLTVCVENNGQFTVSGGSGTYTWQQLIPAQTVNITNAATCTQCGGTWNAFANQCFNPFPFPITSCTVPASYQTYATGTTTNPPTYYPIRIFTSNGDTVILNSAPTQSCCLQPNPPLVNDTTICTGNTATLFSTFPSGATFQWYTVASGGSPIFTGNPYVTPSLTTTTSYFVEAVASGCTSTRTNVIVNVINPTAPTVNGVTICSGNSATLTATDPAGTTFQWFTVSTGGTPIFVGNPFTTPVLSNNTTYYVEAIVSGCTSTRTAVTVTIQNISTPTVADIQICSNTSGTFTATAPAGATFQWYNQATGGTLLHTGSTFTTPVLTSTTTYYVEAIQGNCTSSRIAVSANVSNFIPSPTVSDITICTGTTGTFTATAPIGAIFDWYDQATGGSLLHTGSSFTTPVLTSTTTYYVEAIQGNCTSSRAAVTVNVLSSLPSPIVANTTICEGQTANLNVTSPVGVQFDWYNAPSGGTLIFTGNPFTTPALSDTTTYYVEAVASGCTSSRTAVTVTVNPIPLNPSLTDTTICFNQSVTLNANATSGSQVLWYDTSTGGTLLHTGSSFTTPNLIQTTTYYVESVLNGCTSIRTSVNVNVISVQLPTVSDTSICENTNALLSASGQSGVVFQWYSSLTGTPVFTGNPLITPILNDTTTYYVEAVLNGCTSGRIPVNVNVIPTPANPVAPDISVCAGGTATLEAISPSIATFEWFDVPTGGTPIHIGSTYTIPAPASVTVYYVQVVVNGCRSGRTAVTVTPASINPPTLNDITICQGQSGTLVISSPIGANYNWYDAPTGGNLLQSGVNTIFTTPILNSTTTYYVEVIQNGCTSNRASVNVNVNIQPNTPVVSNVTICENQNTNLVAFSNGTHHWYDANGNFISVGDTFTTPILQNSTSYFVESILNGCTSSRVPVIVTVFNLNIENTLDSLCTDSLVVLNVPVINGTIVNWYNQNGNFIQTGNTLSIGNTQVDTLYYYEYISNNCTTNRASYSLRIFPNPMVSFVTNPERNSPTDIQNSTFTFFNNSQNGTRYVWYFGDGDSLVTTNKDPVTHTYKAGEYDASLCVYNQIGCVNCFQYGKLIIIDDFVVWIPNVFTPNNDGTNDKFEYVLKGIQSIELEIYDRWGNLIHFNENMNTFWDGTKNGKPCPEGVYTYHLKMTKNNGKLIRRFGTVTLLR